MTGNDDEDVRSVPDQLTLLDFYSCSTLNIRSHSQLDPRSAT